MALQAGNFRRLQRRLLAWFHANKRALPWRETRDPYRIWISEIMLQQTRVAAVLPYYRRFLNRFPSVQALAKAPERDVLRAWAGLGYYSRARNLQAAAREIVRRHGGRFPRALEEALGLPGVGRYTAAAVLSIAYDVPLAVLDGNVARVLARLAALRGDLRRPARWKQLAAAAQRLLPPSAPGDWNQAMMELGATVCTPQSPACQRCPVAKSCRARALHLQERIPAPRRRRPPEDVRLAAAVLLDPRGRTLLVRPPPGEAGGLFARLWQFPAVRVELDGRAEAGLKEHLRAQLGLQAARLMPLAPASHSVTYRRVTLLPFLVSARGLPGARPQGAVHLPLREVCRWPTSSATRKIAQRALAAVSRGETPAPEGGCPATFPARRRGRSRAQA
jgi:A/G-specific adenine glycosylase